MNDNRNKYLSYNYVCVFNLLICCPSFDSITRVLGMTTVCMTSIRKNNIVQLAYQFLVDIFPSEYADVLMTWFRWILVG